MARVAREKSGTGIYHVMLRGINRQTIFEDNQDRVKFLETLERYKDACEFELYSYCLMDNHVHLLMKETVESISRTIKRICSSYVHWYNAKYERCGHLFQERFKSEVIETDSYFLTVLRYIHQNPVKAKIVKTVAEYKWSSYKEYIGKSRFVDVNLGFNYFSKDRLKAISLFIEFMNQDNDDQCLDIVEKIKLSDEEVREHIRKLGILSPTSFQQLDKDKRDCALSRLKGLEGVTARQIARITGISKSVVIRA
ncbi:MAG: transposase [Alkaliphilus sp.]|nr:transposase [Alkaliphilus sp.]